MARPARPPAARSLHPSATHAASRTSEPATSCCARRSTCSIRSWLVVRRSACSRQIRTDPDADSTNESMPKPSRATEPAASPAVIATRPSTMFQPTVRYSRRSARCRRAARWPGARLTDGSDRRASRRRSCTRRAHRRASAMSGRGGCGGWGGGRHVHGSGAPRYRRDDEGTACRAVMTVQCEHPACGGLVVTSLDPDAVRDQRPWWSPDTRVTPSSRPDRRP